MSPKRGHLCRILVICLVIPILFGRAAPVHADDLPPCTGDFPEGPIIERHLDQADIVSGKLSFRTIIESGQRLFEAAFNSCDGQGRPASTGTGEKRAPGQPRFTRVSSPDANSCAGCHNQPRSGGAGDFVANVFVLGQAADPVLSSIDAAFSNSRNTLGMFGSGAIEMLAREMSAALIRIRDQAIAQAQRGGQAVTLPLEAKGVGFGEITARPDGSLDTGRVQGVDPDLIIKPFHQAGVVVSLREFTDNAMNHHFGMQAAERFDLNPEKGIDFDQDGISNELSIGDITAITIWQAALGIPGRLVPADPLERDAVSQGEQLFSQIGCADCHRPELMLDSRLYSEPNPYNPPGTWSDLSKPYQFDMTVTGEGPFPEPRGEGAVIRAYTDLKRHNLCDVEDRDNAIRYYCNEQLDQNRPVQDGRPGSEYFITRKLWDVGNSAPYGHAGDITTITGATLMHGGEARASRDTYVALAPGEQKAIIWFLQSLQVLPEGSPRVVVEGQEALATPAAEAPQEEIDYVLVGGIGLASLLLVLAALLFASDYYTISIQRIQR